MNKDFDVKVTIKMLETMAQLGVFMLVYLLLLY